MNPIRPETRHTVVLLVGTGITTAFGLAYGIYATRVLGEGSVGAFTHALSVVAFLQIAFGPINGTVAKFSAEYAGTGALGRVRSLVDAVMRRVGAYGAVALAVAVVAAIPLATFWKYTSPVPLIVALLITFGTLVLSVARGALRGLQQFGTLNTNTIFEAGCRLLIGLALLSIWADASAALFAYFIAIVATLGLSRRQLNSSWKDARSEPVDGRSVRRFALPMFVLMLTSAAFQNIDMLVAKRVLSIGDSDAYGVAFYLSGRAIAVLVTPFNTLMLPMLANLHGAGRPTRGPFLRVCAYFLILTTAPLALFFLWPGELMQLLYDDRFTAAIALLFPLAIARLIGHLCHMIGLAGAAGGRFGSLYLYVAGLLVQLPLLILFAQTGEQIVHVLLGAQGVTLIALCVQLVISTARRRSIR